MVRTIVDHKITRSLSWHGESDIGYRIFFFRSQIIYLFAILQYSTCITTLVEYRSTDNDTVLALLHYTYNTTVFTKTKVQNNYSKSV